jgi:hypothetical protein
MQPRAPFIMRARRIKIMKEGSTLENSTSVKKLIREEINNSHKKLTSIQLVI